MPHNLQMLLMNYNTDIHDNRQYAHKIESIQTEQDMNKSKRVDTIKFLNTLPKRFCPLH